MSYTNPAAYNRFMGRWSALLAPACLRFVDIREGQHVLDVGCGTGSLSRAVLASGATTKITGIDPVPSFVEFARELVSDPRAQFRTGAVEALPFADHTFDAALGLLVLQDFNDPMRAIKEMTRVTRGGGEAVAPQAVRAHRRRNSLPKHASLKDLERLWKTAGLCDIATATLELPMAFASFEDFWEPFLGGATPTTLFAAALDVQTRGRFGTALRHNLKCVQRDGSFVLAGHAWAVRGIAGTAIDGLARRDPQQFP
jgi:SAM-dependent methyltransferase